MRLINNKLKATGLVEVITVLAILAMTMVTVVGVTVKGMRQVKRNELEDRAVGIQLRALEYAKSPTELSLGTLPKGTIKSYSIDVASVSTSGIKLKAVANRNELNVSNCNEDSYYYVDLGPDSKEMICNQVIIESKLNQSTGGLFYEITSRLVFRSTENFEIRELLAYRSDTQ